MSSYFPALTSTLFRFVSYIFLQIIPTRLAVPALPSLYILHIISLWSHQRSKLPAKKELKVSEEKQNGSSQVNGHAPPIAPKDVNPWLALLFSLPAKSRVLNRFNIIINTLLFAAALDLTLTPFLDPATDVIFARVGAVYPDAAKVIVRFPAQNTTQHTLRVRYRQIDARDAPNSSPWRDGPLLDLSQEHDWVNTTKLTNLWPDTLYEYTISGSETDQLSYPSSTPTFKTFPDPRLQRSSHFRFVASSCITPNFPYKGPLEARTIEGFDLLADYLDESTVNVTELTKPPVSFMTFLGDFIYADVPFYAGDDKEAYRRLYRRNYASPSFRKIYERLPIFHAYDDHEIINNYAGNDQNIPPFGNASSAYDSYAGLANYDSSQPDERYFDFEYADASFFVMDTRKHRSFIHEEDREHDTLLGQTQLQALKHWLHKTNETSSFKFIVSSVPFTSLWTHDAQVDSWAGFPTEKKLLLDLLHTVPNVIIISGDRHEFAAVEFNTADPKGYPVLEFSTSPLNMFYIPFIHTLRPRSDETFAVLNNDTNEETIPYERTIAYIPEGNVKWSTFEVNTLHPVKPTLTVQTMIDGKEAYRLQIVGKPIQQARQLTSLLVNNFKGIFDMMGFKPGRWF
ncbi:hypothetical protein CVT24_003393 [Panaeolus cyanescens]|uniref:PhoD-like phosphatase metallophosphatase domain-containing protein n=1 Tax=Panaeolus cyanescens TaxID=181874 RepID=A0A409Y782_9AGAR|nr:hypothetical protein CVT24_003393 [Panaeolus cyanescens]